MLLILLAASKSRLTASTNITLSLIKYPKRSFSFQFKQPSAKSTLFSNSCKNAFVTMRLMRPHNGMAGPGSGATSMVRKSPTRASHIISKLIRFVWPKTGAGIKIRVVIALALLIASKLLNVSVPFVFKWIVDYLNDKEKIEQFAESAKDKVILGMIVLALAYGAARASASLFGELRNAVFARVAQSSVTDLATQVSKMLKIE